MTTPQLGAFGVTPTYGNWRDRLAAGLIRYGTNSPVNHAFLYVGTGKIVEAAPGGARHNDADAYGDNVTWSNLDLDDTTRAKIVAHAESLIGTPYGWADILAITLAQDRAGRHVNSHTWWVRRINNWRRLICSQLVDVAYQEAGIHLFTDGRLPGLVSPGDLYRLIEAPATTTRKATV